MQFGLNIRESTMSGVKYHATEVASFNSRINELDRQRGRRVECLDQFGGIDTLGAYLHTGVGGVDVASLEERRTVFGR
jgi:hypothetical protein